jgi:hypothetical protein
VPKGGNARTQPPSHHENAILLDRFPRDPVPFRLRHGLGTTRDGTRNQPAVGGSFRSVGSLVALCPFRAELPASSVGPTDVDLSPDAVGSPGTELPAYPDHPADASVSAVGTSSGFASGGTAPSRSAADGASNSPGREGDPAGAASIHPADSSFPDAAERDAVHAAGIQAVDPTEFHDAVGDS